MLLDLYIVLLSFFFLNARRRNTLFHSLQPLKIKTHLNHFSTSSCSFMYVNDSLCILLYITYRFIPLLWKVKLANDPFGKCAVCHSFGDVSSNHSQKLLCKGSDNVQTRLEVFYNLVMELPRTYLNHPITIYLGTFNLQ